MSNNKPPIFAHCPAGSEYETVHMADFEKSAAYIPVPLETGGNKRLEFGKRYRVYSDKTDEALAVTFGGQTVSFNTANVINRCAATVGDYVYIFGGCSATTGDAVGTIFKLNTTTGAVTDITSLVDQTDCDKDFHSSCCLAIGTDIYFFGGKYDDYLDNTLATVSGTTQKIIKFDTLTNKFTSPANCTNSNGTAYTLQNASCTIDSDDPNYVLIFGGKRHVVDDVDVLLTNTYRWQIGSNTAGSVAGMPYSISDNYAGSLNGRSYVLGGTRATGGAQVGDRFTYPFKYYALGYAELPELVLVKYMHNGAVGCRVGSDLFVSSGASIANRFRMPREKNELTSALLRTNSNDTTFAAAVGTDIWFSSDDKIKKYSLPTYNCGLRIGYTDNGIQKYYDFNTFNYVGDNDGYFDFEFVNAEDDSTNDYLVITYRINGYLEMRKIKYTSSVAVGDVELTGAGELYLINEKAQTVALPLGKCKVITEESSGVAVTGTASNLTVTVTDADVKANNVIVQVYPSDADTEQYLQSALISSIVTQLDGSFSFDVSAVLPDEWSMYYTIMGVM